MIFQYFVYPYVHAFYTLFKVCHFRYSINLPLEMVYLKCFKFKLHFLLVFVVVVHGAERSGLFEGIRNFNGLSMDAAAINKRVCSVRYV